MNIYTQIRPRWSLGIGLVLGIILLVTSAAGATDDVAFIEDGVTFYHDGTCVEADGDVGLWSFTPPCFTTDVYDEVFSAENLATVPSWFDPDVSVAEAVGLVGDTTPASDRPRAFMGEVLPTFREVIEQVALTIHIT